MVDMIVKTDVVEHQVFRMNGSAKHGGIKRMRKRKRKVFALIEQLACLKTSMLFFARNFEVPFTNNAAERTIKNLKSKSNVAGNFRSDDGECWYLKSILISTQQENMELTPLKL